MIVFLTYSELCDNTPLIAPIPFGLAMDSWLTGLSDRKDSVLRKRSLFVAWGTPTRALTRSLGSVGVALDTFH